ncbi:MAG: glycoside hydrolase family 9 protein [Oscillospiraceae bacterium]|nr:glycoside hydrolase family 9 protein [Oscillospiraceae bacterium]
MKHSISSRIKAAAASAALLATSVLSGFSPAMNVTAADADIDVNFARLLQHSMTFYDANMCGKGVEEKSLLSWRGDCHLSDAKVPLHPIDKDSTGVNLTEAQIKELSPYLDPDGDGCVDVSGGFHDAGDHVEFGMPENYSAATLGFGYYEFRESYTKNNLDGHIETILRHFNDYLMRCTFLDEDGKVVAHCYQVGDGDIDHKYWQSPETDGMSRPAFFLTADKPQVDYCFSAAASLIINYLNFKDTDPEYAEESLKYGKALYDFAYPFVEGLKGEEEYLTVLSDNGDGPKQYYGSSKWTDDFVWCATWLYTATDDVTYLKQALPKLDIYAADGWCYCWNDMWSGAILRLAIIDETHPDLDLQNMYREAQGKNQYDPADYWAMIEKALDVWEKNYSTPQGYSFLSTWGSARYDTAMQLIHLLYDKYHNGDKPSKRSEWAKGQMEYLMGKNDITYMEPREDGVKSGPRCFIVGYNDYSCKNPHHRASSGTLEAEDTSPQRHVLYGALVGGPDGKDAHNDVTADWIYNEVTIDYNAAFVGAAAGLWHFYGSESDEIDADFPPAEANAGEDGEVSNNYWIEAFAVDDLHDDGAGTTKVSFLVRTDSPKPVDQIKVRYYIDGSEISNIAGVKATEAYDQSSAEAAEEGGDGIINEQLIKYDKKANTYYVEVSWDGYKIANSGKKYQFIVVMYYGDMWDPKNDWSYQELPVLTDSEMFGKGNEVKTDYICIYDGEGNLLGGTEPDGTTPSAVSVEDKTDTTETTAQPTTEKPTETKESTTAKDIMYGDVNDDKKVDIMDVIALNKYLLGSDKLDTDAQARADVDLNEKVESTDSLNILKYVVELIDALPTK